MKTRDFLSWIPSAVASGSLPDSFDGVAFDTRLLKPGQLYVALKGEARDGHEFVGRALASGAAAALVSSSWQAPDGASAWPLLRVPDPLAALSMAATAWRRTSRACILGITGSSGKTTTRQMTASLLSGAGPTCSTAGNFNNAIGLPLSLLRLTAEDRFGVFECGTNHPGEIAHLAAILQPEGALIASIGTAHIGNFGSTEKIANEKADLLRALPANGFAVLCRETLHFDLLAAASPAPVTTTSLKTREADFCGSWTPPDATGFATLTVTERATGAITRLRYPLPGEHNASNLLLAFAAARRAGITAVAATEGLQHFTLPGNRWELHDQGGVTFINDAYNANPDSMTASLHSFFAAPAAGRRLAVLGDMLELGEQSAALHAAVGQRVAAFKPDALFTIGEMASTALADAAAAAGLPAARIFRYANATAARAPLHAFVRPGDSVLLKASRGLALEKLL